MPLPLSPDRHYRSPRIQLEQEQSDGRIFDLALAGGLGSRSAHLRTEPAAEPGTRPGQGHPGLQGIHGRKEHHAGRAQERPEIILADPERSQRQKPALSFGEARAVSR